MNAGDPQQQSWLSRWASEKAKFTWESFREEQADISPIERETLRAERFGLLDNIVETADLVFKSLAEMESAIDSIEQKEAYETAMFVIPEYVQDDNFRLAFLRADRFNATAAAQRMVKYWERKVELFGADVAFKAGGSSILDLSKEDLATFANGSIQILPNCDEYGRALLFFKPTDFSNNVDSMIQYHWMILHMAIFDPIHGERNQKNGQIQLWMPRKQQLHDNFHLFDTIKDAEKFFTVCARDTSDVFPIRIVSFHVFFSPQRAWFATVLTENMLVFLGRFVRLRLDFYIDGRHDENCERLVQQGILPVDTPLEIGGLLEFDYSEWLRQQLHLAMQKERIYSIGDNSKTIN